MSNPSRLDDHHLNRALDGMNSKYGTPGVTLAAGDQSFPDFSGVNFLANANRGFGQTAAFADTNITHSMTNREGTSLVDLRHVCQELETIKQVDKLPFLQESDAIFREVMASPNAPWDGDDQSREAHNSGTDNVWPLGGVGLAPGSPLWRWT